MINPLNLWKLASLKYKAIAIAGLIILLISAYQLNNFLVAKNAKKDQVVEINKKTTTVITNREKENEKNRVDVGALTDDELYRRLFETSREGDMPIGVDRDTAQQTGSSTYGQEVCTGCVIEQQKQKYPFKGMCEYPEVEVLINGECVLLDE